VGGADRQIGRQFLVWDSDRTRISQAARGRFGPLPLRRPDRLAALAWHQAFRQLASLRLAIWLIFGIAGLTLAGTLIEQAPPGIRADQMAYARWLADARGRYGGWVPILDRLQFFDVFHSVVLRGLLVLLAISIVACTMTRWRATWATVFHSRTRATDSFFSHARYHAQWNSSLPRARAALQVGNALSGSRYRVSREINETSVFLFADRNRFSRFATYLTHLSLVMILAGAIIGGIWGFKDDQFVIAEDSARDLGFGTNISVRLEHFTDEYYADGGPKDYRSDVVIFDNGRQVKQGSIQVNSPLHYKGIAFHQAFFGDAAVLKITDANGNPVFDDSVPLVGQLPGSNHPFGMFTLPQQGLTVFVIGPEPGVADTNVPNGDMRLEVYSQDSTDPALANLAPGVPAQLGGLVFTFEREGRFAGLKVIKDPGVNIIWAAGTLLIIGLFARFYLPPRRIWARCSSREDGTTEVRIAMPAERDFSLEREFDRISGKLGDALHEPPPARYQCEESGGS